MRLWHYKLIPVLPKQMLVSQWRELIAIKRQWEKGTLKHRLVSYVKDYDREYYEVYCNRIINELINRKINISNKLILELDDFHCEYSSRPRNKLNYHEHNNRYLTQCYYNLQEKYDRGIVSQEEWEKIDKLYEEEI